ncbi:YdcF family protein [Psychromonas hadalis]|uniref:YdcF family protein n=1 Tax=Psychromonas hadalis TaxID=211669 RepID=UPI0003B6F6A4|nr:YdcF family protein [Psychromonas hadalis]
MTLTQLIEQQAKIIWDYHLLHHSLKKSDCIFVLGSNDIRVAQRGAELYLAGFAPLLIFSGAIGKLTEGKFTCSEAQYFSNIAIKMGVPESAILIEDKATNTGENISLTMALLKEKKLKPASYIVVQKPFMERRAFAVFKHYLPEPELIITSPQISYQDYANADLSHDDILNVMVGDLQRIREYPQLGFQIAQDIPDNVWQAFKKMVAWGYTKHLI